MSNLFHEDDDVLKDFEIKVKDSSFKCHKYILLAYGSTKMEKLIKDCDGNILDLSDYTTNHHLIKQVLQYIYTQTCDFTKEGTLPFKPPMPISKQPDQNGFNLEDINESAHKIYRKKKQDKNSQSGQSTQPNPLTEIQEVAKSLGLQEMIKDLDNYSYNYNSNSVQLKKDCKKVKGQKSWSRTKHEEISDVNIKTEDEKEFFAHKCMLSARLDYFKSMFCMGWCETQSETTSVSLPHASQFIQVLLDFVYTDFELVTSEDPEFLCNILVMADSLLIPRLVQICEKQLATLLTLKNVGEILQLAAEFHALQLKSNCMDFVCYNLGALLESKGLDVVDNEVLAQVSLHYQTLNRALSTRKITPYSYGPSTEEIEHHVENTGFNEDNLEDLLELETEALKDLEAATVASNSAKKRRRQISTGSTGSSGAGSDTEPDVLNVISKAEAEEDEDSLLEGFQSLNVSDKMKSLQQHPQEQQQSSSFTLKSSSNKKSEDIIKSFFNNPQEFSKKHLEQQSNKKFHKLSQKERKKLQLNTSEKPETEIVVKSKWSGWGQPSNGSIATKAEASGSSSLASIMQEEEAKDVEKSSPSPISQSAAMANGKQRTRKQSWRSLSFDFESNDNVLAQSPPISNPWKKISSNGSSDKNEALDLQEILHEESLQSANLSKAKSKPFSTTQLEEKAMADLKNFYNAENVFDECIVVQRVSQQVLATPIWKRAKN